MPHIQISRLATVATTLVASVGGLVGCSDSGAEVTPPAATNPCPTEQIPCSGSCVLPDIDTSNCGFCGVTCGTGQQCLQGQCICQGNLEACPSGCADLTSSGENCGQCGAACPTGTACSVGQCVSECGPDEVMCGQSCVAVVSMATNILHCGGCDNPCPAGQECGGGACTCPGGLELCGGRCVDTRIEPAHCGGCDAPCVFGETCAGGQCVGTGTGGTGGTGGAETGGDGGTTGGGTGGTGAAGSGGTGGSIGGTGGADGGTGGTTGGGTAGSGAAGSGGTGGSTGGTGGSTCNDACPFPGGITWGCQTRFMYGVNYAWQTFAGDFGGIADWGQEGVSGNATAVSNSLADMKAHGANVIRWWVWPQFRGEGVQVDGSGTPTGLGGTALADLDRALELAEQHDLYLMLTLFSFDNFNPSGNNSGLWVPGVYGMAVDSTKRAALVNNVVRPFAQRAEQSPNAHRLIAWDVINEPEWAMHGASKYCGDEDFGATGGLETVSHDQMETFVSAVIAGLRQESSALITIGNAAMRWKCAWTQVDTDFYQFHIYDWVDDWWPYSDSPSDFGIDDKPVVMGEFPFAGLNGADYLTVLRSWFGNGYAGALGWSVTDGTFNWNGYKSSVQAFANEQSCQTQY